MRKIIPIFQEIKENYEQKEFKRSNVPYFNRNKKASVTHASLVEKLHFLANSTQYMWSFMSRRCCCACGVAFVAIAVVFITTSLVTWYSFFGGLDRVSAEAAKVGRIKVRIIHNPLMKVTSYQMPVDLLSLIYWIFYLSYTFREKISQQQTGRGPSEKVVLWTLAGKRRLRMWF